MFWAVDSQHGLYTRQTSTAVQRTFCLLPLPFLLVIRGLSLSTVLAFRPLVCQCVLQHSDMLIQLVVQLLCAAHLALLLCDLSLHLGTLNVPRISGALMVVPFELQEAHYSCSVVSPAALPQRRVPRVPDGVLPCNVYSVPAGPLPSPPPAAPPAFMADGDCHAMADMLCCVVPVCRAVGGDGACDVGGRPTSAMQVSKLQDGPQEHG